MKQHFHDRGIIIKEIPLKCNQNINVQFEQLNGVWEMLPIFCVIIELSNEEKMRPRRKFEFIDKKQI